MKKVNFEHADPILRVSDMGVTLKYYLDVLGFRNASWGNNDFTHIHRDTAGIHLCRGGQGRSGTWVWIGVDDVAALCVLARNPGATCHLQRPIFYAQCA